MDKNCKEALQIAKEIVVKFAEVGRITPANFAEHFPSIYEVVLNTLNKEDAALEEAPPHAPPAADETGESPAQKRGKGKI